MNNAEKCYLQINTNESVDFQLGGAVIEKRDCEKMLGVTLIEKIILPNMWEHYAVKLIINWEH